MVHWGHSTFISFDDQSLILIFFEVAKYIFFSQDRKEGRVQVCKERCAGAGAVRGVYRLQTETSSSLCPSL